MMKANELRIGNWVVDNGDVENPIKILYITEDNTEWLEPIPLTEEILLKCGFDFIGDLFDCLIYRKGIVNVSILKGVYTFSLKRDRKSNYVPLTEFKHVHQLQNLFYSLSGEELKIEL